MSSIPLLNENILCIRGDFSFQRLLALLGLQALCMVTRQESLEEKYCNVMTLY